MPFVNPKYAEGDPRRSLPDWIIKIVDDTHDAMLEQFRSPRRASSEEGPAT